MMSHADGERVIVIGWQGNGRKQGHGECKKTLLFLLFFLPGQSFWLVCFAKVHEYLRVKKD